MTSDLLRRWELLCSSDSEPGPDLELELWQDQIGLLTVSSAADPPHEHYRLRFSDQASVDIFPSRQQIREARPSPGVPQDTRDHFLADQVLPRVLAHEGRLVLHGAAVKVGRQAIVILGDSGQGKSTLAASFAQAGFALLGDDAMVVSRRDDRPFVKAVYPSLRLLPDSIGALYSEAPDSGSVAHYTPKRRIRLPVATDSGEAELATIFVIAPPAEVPTIVTERLSIAQSSIALITNSFALDPTDLKLARAKLEDASACAREVPAFAISYPRDYARLPDVRAAMLKRLEQVQAAAGDS